MRRSKSSPSSATSARPRPRARRCGACSAARRPAPISARSRSRAKRQQTDSEQSVKAMLLDRGATANCKPELEIYRRRRQMRARRDRRRARHGAIVLRRLARARPRRRPRVAARRLHRRAVGRRRRRRARHRRRRARRGEGDRMNVETRLNTRARACATSSRRSGELALSRQRRDRAKAAGGDRRDRRRLWPRLRHRPSRGLPALGGDDPGLRSRARRGRASCIGGQDAKKSSSPAARPRRSTSSRSSFPRGDRNRVLLSALEHHSNIVPWQLAGYAIDVCPLTDDGQIDLDAAEAMVTEQHAIVAFAHVSNVLGSILDAGARRRTGAHGRRQAAARRLPGGAAPRRSMSPRSTATSTSSRPQALRPDRDRRLVGARPRFSTRCRHSRAAAR